MKIIKPTPTCPEDEAYIKYIDEHRKNVYQAFAKFGRSICLCLALVNGEYDVLRRYVINHDASKYRKEEFDGYRQWFFPKQDEEKNGDAFQSAWRHHYENNPHHWQYFVKNGRAKEMPLVNVAEMLLDWIAMSMKFKNSPIVWYNQNKENMLLDKNTQKKVESVLNTLSAYSIYPFRTKRTRKHKK